LTSDDRVHRLEDSVGKLLLAKLIPDMLLRVEFRRIAREAVQTDVFGNPQFLGSVGAGSIDGHDDEFTRMGLADLCKKLVHLLGVHLRADLPVQFPLQGADSSVDIDKLPFIAVRPSDVTDSAPNSVESVPSAQSEPRLET
jgi:hypothetical protein